MTKLRFTAKNGLDNNSNTITGVATPIAATDAANKSYVDNLTPTLGNSGVTAGTYGDSLNSPIITVNAQGLITFAATVGQAASIGGAGLASSNAKNFFFN